MITASVIILSYFGEKSLSETVDAVLNSHFPAEKFEIIIVDNNSQDNSHQIIDQYRKKYPQQIKTLFLPQNIGFACGNNEGFKIARGKYSILLNNDCLVDPDWLPELIKTADSDPKAFSIGSKIMLYPANKNVIQNAGSFVFQDGYGRDIGAIVTLDHQQLYENDIGQYSQTREVYSTCGAAVLYRQEILNKIGLFDPHFFMYYEDTEISERARLAGYRHLYSPKAVVYHHHASSSHEWSPFFIFHTEKGRLLHLLYHFPLKVYFHEYFKFTLKSKLRFIKSVIKFNNIGKSYQYIRVSIYLFFHFPELFLKRLKYSQLYPPQMRQVNYQKILSGFWYFNQ